MTFSCVAGFPLDELYCSLGVRLPVDRAGSCSWTRTAIKLNWSQLQIDVWDMESEKKQNKEVCGDCFDCHSFDQRGSH